MPRPVATWGTFSDLPGLYMLVGPPAHPDPIGKYSVLAQGKPVLTLGAIAQSHGNPYNPLAPGFNPPCALSTITKNVVPNVIVEGKPIAVYGPSVSGSILSCGHILLTPGAVTVMAGK